MDKGAWQATVHGVAKSQTLLSTYDPFQLNLKIGNKSKYMHHKNIPYTQFFFLSWFLRLPCFQYQPTLQFIITIVPTLFKCWNCWINKGLILHSVPHPNATQIVHSVVSGSLQPHGLQHTRFLCTSLSPRVCSASCPLNR